ncbi:MAG: IMP dehydrogenase [Solibacterales bacterium]|nr:IMP dehydrogenase [Bryobacterales bacterium]|tara:strand:- start:1394 stop:2851 length:1458 start_codon:yes stop_codon:yes gene_type:complete
MLNSPVPEALTFDDVLLLPAYSTVLPSDTNTNTHLTRQIALNIPIVSAAMDTVTESRLAIALARQGGLGFVHRNMSIARQAEEVDRVKRSESGMIVDPITMEPQAKIHEALALMERYKISGVPVTENGKLVGILTNRDLRFESRHTLTISEVMTKKNLVTAPVGTTLDAAEKILQQHRIEKLLVVDEDYFLKGLITVKDIQKKRDYPHAAKDERGRLLVGAAVGATGDFLERAQELFSKNIDVLAIDTAHAHTSRVHDAVGALRKAFPDIDLIAGNVAVGEAVKDLISRGVDAVKVGIGPGSICTTRIISGAGVPQISAIAECARAAQGSGVPIISDGGIKYSGDITKALAAGADCVMIGSLLAGTEESPGETVLYQGRTYKSYRGMGSLGAMAEGGRDRYSQESSLGKLVPEGVEGRVPYKGMLGELLHQLKGGIQAGMGYCGSKTIKELKEKTSFVRVSSAGLREAHVHDVLITREAPNYQVE